MSIDTSNGHPAMDYAEHTRTYQGFVRISVPPDETLAKTVADRLRSHARLYQRRLPRGRRLRAQERREQSQKDNNG